MLNSTGTPLSSSSYGPTGQGWDAFYAVWPGTGGNKGIVNLSMGSNYLQINNPTVNNTAFINSHFGALPTANTNYYFEFYVTTGAGTFAHYDWPAIWFYRGNGGLDIPTGTDSGAEIDLMETFLDQQWGSTPNSSYASGACTDADNSTTGCYTDYFTTTSHNGSNHAAIEQNSILTPGVNVTTTPNVYGIELSLGSNGNVMYAVYFNGKLQLKSVTGVNWAQYEASGVAASNYVPSMLLGFNPPSDAGDSLALPMKVYYVRVWSKSVN